MEQKADGGHSICRTLCASTLLVLLVWGCTSQADNNELPGRAPQFALKDLKGQTLRLEDLRGKVVLLNFFATWCAPCRQEIPDLQRLYRRFNDQGLEIVGISLDMEGARLLNPFVQYYGITYPIVLGTREVVVDYGGIRGIPTSFLIDRTGRVAKHFVGFRPVQVFEQSVLELLGNKG
jgi:cytochrome c biogenesis protein CcmG/thiol:disulfide interchange protein DsbE